MSGPRVRAWTTVLAGTVAFYVLVHFAGVLAHGMFPGSTTWVLQRRAALALSASIAGELTAVLLLLLYLRGGGRPMAELGFRRPGTGLGWSLALLLAALTIAGDLAGPLRGQTQLLDFGGVRIYASLVAGLGAGFCEETVFRGFIMTQLERARVRPAAQIAASGLLFGLAHMGWGGLHGGYQLQVALGAAASTAVLGALYAGVYLLSRRSLWPVIVAHTLTDVVIEPWLVMTALSGVLGAH